MSILVRFRARGPGTEVRDALRHVARASGIERRPSAVWMPALWNEGDPGEQLDDFVEVEVFGVENRVTAIERVRAACASAARQGVFLSGGDFDLQQLAD